MAVSLYSAGTLPTDLNPLRVSVSPNEYEAQEETTPATGDLERRVNETMQQSQYRQLGRIVCRVDRGIATLHGRVPSYFLKQLAQEQASRVDDVSRVVNLVEVIYV